MKFFFPVVLLSVLALSGCNCNPPNCEPGVASCACKTGDVCNEGLACVDSKCVPPVAAGLQVDAAARGCELLLTESGTSTVVSANFKNGVKGTFIRQPPRVAVTFVSGGDTAIGNNVELGLGGPATGVTVTKSSCVDVKGARVGGSVSLR
jgi:hypothetical protein